ncbi:MAG: DUF4350 domain-containing protein [Deltaproteobacteria bacterium]|nr:DUF4350 domain-containing protein [Deltaproteobacteria bacterium]
MARSARRRLRALAALLLVLLAGAEARAAAFDLGDTSWEGCSELLALARHELGEESVIVRAGLDWASLGPGDGVLVLHPLVALDVEEAAAFMMEGGRLAVVDDYGRGEELLAYFEIRRVSLPSRPMAFLRQNPALPIAEPVIDGRDGRVLGPHPVVSEVDRVVLNHATGLLREPEPLTPVLRVRAVGESDAVVALAGMVGKGRLFAMGDPSAFINQMLRYPGNQRLAVGLLRYLVDREGAKSHAGRLFLLAGRFDERGAFGGDEPLRKRVERSLRALRDGIGMVRREGLPWWLHVALAALGVAFLLRWAARALVRPYQPRVPQFAQETPALAQGGVAGRVALLSSPLSPPALALLEVKSVLTEALSAELGESRLATVERLVDVLGQRGLLSVALAARLRPVLELMRRAELAIVSGQPARVRAADVRRAAEVAGEVLAAGGVERSAASDPRPVDGASGAS